MRYAFSVLVVTFSLRAGPQERAFLEKYCVGCHNARAKVGGLSLDDAAPQNTEIWEKVAHKLRLGSMPPQGMPQPDPAMASQIATAIETTLDRAAAEKPNPGRALIHRLNRTEYGNTIRDLLALEVDPASLLPPDSSSSGFDNNADTLKISPALLEQYLTAGIKISDLAVGDPKRTPGTEIFPIRTDVSQNEHFEGLPIGTRGGKLVRYNIPLDGEYVLKGALYRAVASSDRGIESNDTPQDFEITLDGARVHLAQIGGKEDDDAGFQNMAERREMVAARLQVRVAVKAGPHLVGFAFLKKTNARSQKLLEPFPRTSKDGRESGGLPELQSVSIAGPFHPTGLGDTPSRRRIFVCRPASGGDEVPCAKRILSTLARRAYRRPVTDADLEALLSFYQRGRNQGDFERGIRMAIPRILTSPSFLFRVEADPAGVPANSAYRLGDLELASRLSFFLWSSIPDEELLGLATRGKLKDPVVLAQQVRRMLADSRSRALVTNLTGQWLGLRKLDGINPDREVYPTFDDNLRQAFRRETELFFESIVREDRNALDLLNADYTFLNERLAKHYGIPNVYGDQFRRVPMADENRRGLLGQGSVLMVTSSPLRTSPVLRGKWILTAILNAPPPSPPLNVPALAENAAGTKPRSVRDRLEEHRKNATCATCHKNLDPPGFALENFDAIGEWRNSEAGTLIDGSGTLSDGAKVDGPAALRRALLSRSGVFVEALIERLLTYALGRGADANDMPAIRAIDREAARNNNRFSSIILGIVSSTPFQMKVKNAEER